MKSKMGYILFLITFFVGCLSLEVCRNNSVWGSDNYQEDNAIPPTKKKKLLKWLKAGKYLDTFTGEPEVHESAGPHGGNVRTFYNPILVEDLEADQIPFRKGAAIVKELYLDGEEEVIGYAVMIKVRKKDKKKGKSWKFYETFDGKNKGAIYGRGVPLCADCHGDGVDYLLSDFRP